MTSNSENIVEIQGATKKFGSFVALSDLNLNLKEGEFFFVTGAFRLW